jgi:hypothetical protein
MESSEDSLKEKIWGLRLENMTLELCCRVLIKGMALPWSGR